MEKLLDEIKKCVICKNYLPNLPNPVVQASVKAKIIIIGQAPGQRVQFSGVPWDDQSGNELRRWLGVNKDEFYDAYLFALIPMGFCYPGKGKNGDLPPRPECAPFWHQQLLNFMPDVKLVILIGQYAQNYYLGNLRKPSLTETVKNFNDYLPAYLPLVHPSPRNKIWQKRNPWFEFSVVPALQEIIRELLKNNRI